MIKGNNFEISESGINVIHNGIKKEYIEYSKIIKARIKRDFFHRNWEIGFVLGIFIALGAFFWLFEILKNFKHATLGCMFRTGWFYFITQIIITVLGIIISVISLKRSMVLFIWQKRKQFRIQLFDIEKQNKMDELRKVLKLKIKNFRG